MKKPIYIIFSILVIALFTVVGCSNNSNQETTDSSHAKSDASTITAFISSFDEESSYKLKSKAPINLKDENIGGVVEQYFSDVFNKFDKNSDIQEIFAFEENNNDSLHPVNYLGVKINNETDASAICVCGLFNENKKTIDAFHTAFLLLSKNASQADFEKLVEEETFLYGGKSGEISGIQYEVSLFGGYHSISLVAPLESIGL